jgi:CubicO group peptidase (beta-lactamase class C family)
VKVSPHTQFKYSNLAYQLLGEVVSRISGASYPHYVKENILDPLGMSSTVFEPIPDGLLPRVATGYGPRWLSDELTIDDTRPAVWAEGGGLVSCVDDLAKWVALQLRTDALGDSWVLAIKSLREMQRPRYLADNEWTEAFGISWMAVRRDDTIWMQHSGGIFGFSSCVCFHVGERLGVIVLINGRGQPLRLAIDLGELALPTVRAMVKPAERPSRMPDAYAPFLGFYEWQDGALLIRVAWLDGALTVEDVLGDSNCWTLLPASEPDAFTVDAGVRESGESAVFLRFADGRVRGLKLGPVILTRLQRVEG